MAGFPKTLTTSGLSVNCSDQANATSFFLDSIKSIVLFLKKQSEEYAPPSVTQNIFSSQPLSTEGTRECLYPPLNIPKTYLPPAPLLPLGTEFTIEE